MRRITRNMSRRERRSKRMQLLKISGPWCALCQEYMPEGDRTFDHIIPLSRGGSHAIENLRLAHSECNRRRGNRLDE